MPEMTAPIALLIDVNGGKVLFERQSHRRFMPASLTKIMTSYVAFELIKAGKLRLDQRFRMSHEAFRQWHRVGSTMFLADGSDTSVAELLEGIVTVSANDGCIVLAEGVAGNVPAFTALMNDAAKQLGMKDTHYNTPNGWMDEGATYVSAADLAILSTALITRHPDLYARFYGHERLTFRGVEQPNHNPLYGHVAGADGVKTGFTNEAGYGLVGSAIRDGRRLMMVVGGYDNGKVRARESRDFLEWGFAAFEAHSLFGAGAKVGAAEVQGGEARTVALVAPHPLALTLPRGAGARYSLSLRYKGPLRAPIAKGQEVASLIVRVPGAGETRLPLVTEDAVPVAGTLARLRNGLLAMIGQ
ncbi:MAG: D-alanyl-D-alanine carboxypeptidase [Novosphingobium sp. PASSN1]|nr:MAG: D-alanyl-D-alanine carboxypeptidase [Novosphingobium sp. PASSN1]